VNINKVVIKVLQGSEVTQLC